MDIGIINPQGFGRKGSTSLAIVTSSLDLSITTKNQPQKDNNVAHFRRNHIQYEKVQRRASRWITMTKRGELSYRERLLALDLLPLNYDREVRDLVYFFKSLFSYIDVNIDNYVSFVSHGRTRLSHTSRYILQSKLCKTDTFQSSYYNRVVKSWNTVCQEVSPDIFQNPNSFKHYLKRRYSTLISNVYDVDMACTWSLTRDCPCHRT